MKSKNLFCLVAVVLFLAAGVLAGQQAPREIKAVPVAGSLYFVEGLDGGNVAFLATAEGVLVVDSGTSPEEGDRIVAEIAKVTDKPVRYIVLTHYHGDHVFGLQAYPASAVIIAQVNTAENMHRLNEPRIQGALEKEVPQAIAAQKAKVDALRKKRGKELKKEEERLKVLEAEYGQMKQLRLVFPAVAFDSKLRITLGGETVEISHPGRAHTNGDSLVVFPGLKAAAMGDLFFVGSYPYIGAEAGCDTANWIATLGAAAAWDVEKFIPGHGPLADKQTLQRMAAYLGDLRAAVQAAVDSGRSLEQAKKMPLLPAWKELTWPQMFPQNIEAVYKELKK